MKTNTTSVRRSLRSRVKTSTGRRLANLGIAIGTAVFSLTMPLAANAACDHSVSTSAALHELIDGDGTGDASPGDTICLAAGTYLPEQVSPLAASPPTDQDNTFDIAIDNLTIIGAGAGSTILSGDLAGDDMFDAERRLIGTPIAGVASRESAFTAQRPPAGFDQRRNIWGSDTTFLTDVQVGDLVELTDNGVLGSEVAGTFDSPGGVNVSPSQITNGELVDRAIIEFSFTDSLIIARDRASFRDTGFCFVSPCTSSEAGDEAGETMNVFTSLRENAHVVVTVRGKSVTLKYLTIRDGFANRGASNLLGGPRPTSPPFTDIARNAGAAVLMVRSDLQDSSVGTGPSVTLDGVTVEYNNSGAGALWTMGELTLRNSNVSNNFTQEQNGGAIRINRMDAGQTDIPVLKVEDSIIENNVGTSGAGITAAFSVVTITGTRTDDTSTTEIRNNRGYLGQGAAAMENVLMHFDGVVVEGNTGDTNNTLGGGAIFLAGRLPEFIDTAGIVAFPQGACTSNVAGLDDFTVPTNCVHDTAMIENSLGSADNALQVGSILGGGNAAAGALDLFFTRAIVQNSHFHSNAALASHSSLPGDPSPGGSSGGAIASTGNSVVHIKDSEFMNNIADAAGGAIANYGALRSFSVIFSPSLTVTGSKFTGNLCKGNDWVRDVGLFGVPPTSVADCGGAVFNGAAVAQFGQSVTLNLYNTDFRGNRASNGGGAVANGLENSSTFFGIANGGGTVSMGESKFRNNSAGGRGGAVSSSGTGTIVEIQDVQFIDNQAGIDGGALWNGPDATIGTTDEMFVDNRFVHNCAGNQGGGLYNAGFILELLDSPFKENFAITDGGGVFNTGTLDSLKDLPFVGNSDDAIVGVPAANIEDSPVTGTPVTSCHLL